MIKFSQHGIDYDCFDSDYFKDHVNLEEEYFHCNPPRDHRLYHYTIECLICSKLLVTCTCKDCSKHIKKVICSKCMNDNSV
jgi:hypothetical protein